MSGLPGSPAREKRAGGLPRLQAAIRLAWDNALDLIFPPRCAGCGKVGVMLCRACADRLCVAPELSRDIRPLAGLQTALAYAEPLRQVIHNFKYKNQPRLAPVLASYVQKAYDAKKWPATLITAVPMDTERQRERGYNQAALLAAALAARLDIPCDPTLLIKTRHTEQQAHLSAHERWVNVEGAFRADPVRVSGQSIIIVDDVVTTGATLRQCATALLGAGAARVWALTVATPSVPD
jgi:ComF family protein